MGLRNLARPKIEIDWTEFDKLCGIQALQTEIADWFRCSVDTIENKCKQEKGMGFSEYYEQKRGTGKISLRRMQWQAAQKGNITMLIWLGKVHLGQSEVAQVQHTGEVVVNLKITDARA